jgi:hypothetical protein
VTSAFGVDHGEVSKLAVRLPRKAGPGVKGKLTRVKSNAKLAGYAAAHRIHNNTERVAQVLPRMSYG